MATTSAGNVGADLGSAHDVESVAFSPDGRLLALADGRKVLRLWHLPASARVFQMTANINPDASSSWVGRVAFSPSGDRVALASDGQLRVWSTNSGLLLAQLYIALGVNSPTVFTPDGRTIRAIDHRNSVVSWDVGYTVAPYEYLCAAAGRQLTEPEWRLYANGLHGRRVCA